MSQPRRHAPPLPSAGTDILDLLAYIKANPLRVTERDIVADPSCVDYHTYLKSKLWRRIRSRILKRDSHACKRCGGKATAVHHRSYDVEVLRGNKDDQLVSVCEGCHTFIEFDDHGNERTNQDSERLLNAHDPTAFPEPTLTRVGPRKRMVLSPSEWRRMSDVQRARWTQQAIRFGKPVQFGPPADGTRNA